MKTGFVAIVSSITLMMSAAAVVQAQDARLAKFSEQTRTQIEAIVASARASRLPVEPLIDRALQGAAMNAPGDRIVAAVTRLRGELQQAREAFGEGANDAEINAGASALRVGATGEDLALLRSLRGSQRVTMAASVLADLVQAGVPADTGIAVVLALASNARDADYVAFRRNVERDIALGASPAASIGARLQAVGELATDVPGFVSTGGKSPIPVRRKKP